jgi:hypothetical protein
LNDEKKYLESALQKYHKRTFCPRAFCPRGRFVPKDVLSHGRFVSGSFVPPDVLSFWTFCLRTFCPPGRFVPLDVLSHGHFVFGRFVFGCFASGGDLSPNVLSEPLKSLFHRSSYTSPRIPDILPAVHSPLIFFSCQLIPFHNSFLSYQLFLLLPYFPHPCFIFLSCKSPFPLHSLFTCLHRTVRLPCTLCYTVHKCWQNFSYVKFRVICIWNFATYNNKIRDIS